MPRRIFISGGSGFIGTHLIRHLIGIGYSNIINVDILLSAEFSEFTHIGDILDPSGYKHLLDESSVIFHLAAVHRDDVQPLSEYYRGNVEGTRKLCEAASEKGVTRIVFASTVAVYGFAPENTNETGTIAPFNEYGRTKFEAEKVLRQWQAEEPTSRTLAIIRPTVVFGKGNRGNVYNLLKQIDSGRFVMIGNGQNCKSMAYVENVAEFLAGHLTAEPGVSVRNYVDKPDLSMTELVDIVQQALGHKQGRYFTIPKSFGLFIGLMFDMVALVTGQKFAISRIRVEKFCATTVFSSTNKLERFHPSHTLGSAIKHTLTSEFKK